MNTVTPFIHNCINNVLLHTNPNVNQSLLKFIGIPELCMLHSFVLPEVHNTYFVCFAFPK